MENVGFYVFFNEDHTDYYDSDACHLYLFAAEPVEINAHSKIIFDYLIENRNATKTRDQISDAIYNLDHYAKDTIDGRSPIDSAIRLLRSKLDKYKAVIKTIYGVGYMYVGPELTRKDDSSLIAPKTSSDQKEKLASNEFKLSEKDSHVIPETNSTLVYSSSGSISFVMSSLRKALGMLIEANDTNSINIARTYIRNTILTYIFNVAIDFESTDGDDWAREVERHTWLLNKEISSAQSEIMTRNQEPSIINIKQVILDAIRCFHIVTVFLSAQLLRERDALERAGDSIGKEIISSRINKIDFDYQSARDRENEAEKTVDNMIDNYTIGVTNDTPVI